ncbi:MAG: TrkH family potassium uptake protein [Spirochaetota bacterium]
MNPKNVLKPLTALMLIIAGFMALPASIALFYGEYREFLSFAVTCGILVGVSLVMLFLLRNHRAYYLSTRDGFLFVTLSWICASIFGCLPFMLSGSIPHPVDAFFETMSGFTTTGASILTDVESLPRSILFWRSLTHWLGGMGIVVLTVAILPMLGIGGLQLIKSEAPGPTLDKLTPRITETAKILWIIYIGMTALETLLLYIGGVSLFDALTHTFGTLATGGFSTYNTSVGHFTSPYIQWVITVFMVLAGVNFSLHYQFISRNISSVYKDTEFITYIVIFLTFSAAITLSLMAGMGYEVGESFRLAAFQTASILTTTGYATDNFELWPAFARTLLFVLMFIGGCSGSTGGGIKVVRIVTMLKMAVNEMKFLVHPRGIFRIKMNGVLLKKEITYSIAGFFFLYMATLFVTTCIVASSGSGILTSFTTALATVGNIGPGFGMVGPANNYAFYPAYVKLFLTVAMLVGRLEMYTVLVIFSPLFWRR